MTGVARPQAYLLSKFVSNGAGQITFQEAQDEIVSTPLMAVWSKNYDFPSILGSAVSSGSLTAAALATITFTPANPCPWGVNGADANHWVYISGGTGTAEAVKITGGTAVAGGTSGTITFTPANNHTGAWTITSASAGMKEADITAGTTRTIWVSAGTHTLRAPLVLSIANSLVGESAISTQIAIAFAAPDSIVFPSGSSHAEIAHLTIYHSVAQTAGYFMVSAVGTALRAHDLYLGAGSNSWGLIKFDACSVCFASRIFSADYVINIQVGGATGASALIATDLVASSGKDNCISMYHLSGNLDLANYNFQHSTGVGSVDFIYYAAPGATQGAGESTIVNGTMDGSRGAAIYITTAVGGTCFGWVISNLQLTGGATPGHIGIQVSGTVLNVQFNNVQSRGVGTTSGAVLIGGGCCAISFNHCWIGDFSAANTTAIFFGSGAAIAGCSIRNCTIGMTSAGVADASCDYAIDFGGFASADVTIVGNQLYAAVAIYRNVPATKTRWVVANNTKQTVSLASNATLAFGLYDDGQVIEITGTTGVATAITGLREGQYGTLIATNVGNVAFSAVATIAKAFTALQNIPVPFVVYGGKLYGTAYVS